MTAYSDGTVDVYCKVCGRHIGRFQYMGFASAECVDCQEAAKLLEEDKKPKA